MKPKTCLPILLMIMLICMTGCASTTASSNPPSFVQLKVLLTDYTEQGSYATYSVLPGQEVQKIYRALIGFPKVLSETATCPDDKGFRYHLFFQGKDKVTLFEALISSTGCRFAILGKNHRDSTYTNDVRRIQNSFWPLFAQALKIPVQKVFNPSGLPK